MVEEGYLDPILPSPSQIRYLATKWPSKIKSRWGTKSGHIIKSNLAASDPILCKFSPYLCLRHTTQSIVIKEGKNEWIVWDSSTVLKPSDIVMNQITPIAQESPSTFGHDKPQVFIDIYNMRISYLTPAILIALVLDIKACFDSQESTQIWPGHLASWPIISIT